MVAKASKGIIDYFIGPPKPKPDVPGVVTGAQLVENLGTSDDNVLLNTLSNKFLRDIELKEAAKNKIKPKIQEQEDVFDQEFSQVEDGVPTKNISPEIDFEGMAEDYIKKLYANSQKDFKKFNTPENIKKQAAMIKQLLINEQGNMSAKPFTQYITDLRYAGKGESVTNPGFLRKKNTNALKEVMEEYGYGNMLFSKADAQPFIEAQVIAGNTNYQDILEAWSKKYNVPLTDIMAKENIYKYVSQSLKKLNKPTASQLKTEATQFKRSSITNAVEALQKENKNVSLNTMYLKLLEGDETKNLFKDFNSMNNFLSGQTRGGNPLNLNLDSSRVVAKTLTEAYQNNLNKKLTYDDTRNIISVFAKANADKLLDLGLDSFVRARNQPGMVMNFAATSKIRVDPNIDTVDQLINFLNSPAGMEFLKAIPQTPKFKKLLQGKSQENIDMLASFFGDAQQKVRDSYPEILKKQKDVNIIQGAHPYPSSYVKTIFQKGLIPNQEGGSPIKVTDEALQDLKNLVDQRVIDVNMLPSELNYIQTMFDPRIIKGRATDEFNTLYEKLGVTTIAPKFNKKGEVISFNLIGRVKDLPVFSSQRQPGIDFQNIKQQMEQISVDRSLDKYRKYKDGGLVSFEEVLEYDNG